jgi:hypothetical protein
MQRRLEIFNEYDFYFFTKYKEKWTLPTPYSRLKVNEVQIVVRAQGIAPLLRLPEKCWMFLCGSTTLLLNPKSKIQNPKWLCCHSQTIMLE